MVKKTAATGKTTPKANKPGPGVLPDDAMEVAGRKVLAFHFQAMLGYEQSVRRGLTPQPDQPPVELIEPIHDMRVSTRRLRSALRLFTPFLPKKKTKRYRDTLAEIGAALGEVRDLDVLHSKADKYAQTLPEANRSELAPLLKDWQDRLLTARQALLETLDSSAYVQFTMDFGQFVTTPPVQPVDEELALQIRVRYAIPRLIYEQYGIVRAREMVLDKASLDTLHDLRIQAKRFRYMVDSFAEVLGEEVKTVIDAVKALQDHLGDLQDARVANRIMREYTLQGDERQSTSAVLQYMAVREAEMQRLLGEMAQAWGSFTRRDIRRSLALAVAVL